MPTTDHLLSADEAAALLGVKKSTLYAYVSRGLLRRVAGLDGRTRRYLRADVLRLRSQATSRSGHLSATVTDQRLGQPLIQTAITSPHPTSRLVRGRPLQELLLAPEGPFAATVAQLWADDTDASWPVPTHLPAHLWNVARRADRLTLAIVLDASGDPYRFGAQPPAERQRARQLCRLLVSACAPDAERGALATQPETVPAALSVALIGDPSLAEPLGLALACCASEGLDTSAYAARVSASTGADLHAGILAGLAALSGWTMEAERVSAWLHYLSAIPSSPMMVIGQQLARGEPLPGFDPTDSPEGDLRARQLLAAARAHDRTGGTALQLLEAVLEAARARQYPPPGIPLGLAALGLALHLPADATTAIAVVARVIDWTAHIQEQRAQNTPIRPITRYTGPGSP